MLPGCQWTDYREVWLVDTEFSQPPGERPTPICQVSREFRTSRTIRLGPDELRSRRTPPYPTGPDTLIVAYLASAELQFHLAMGWPLPMRILDLYVEFRHRLNGFPAPHGWGLLGALLFHGLDALDAAEKDAMRLLAERGGPWTPEEIAALIDYCLSDVLSLDRLLPAMLPHIDLGRAVLCRGRYMRAVARMEWLGVPVDVSTLDRLRRHWTTIQDRLIADIDARFGVFDGRRFKADRWTRWVARHGLHWPLTETGKLCLDRRTFREMARTNPDVAIMQELRNSLSELRLFALAVGADGRNRTLLSPFRARTSRNQPSNSKFVFGPSTWVRSLIKPPPGLALAYVDWSQQEFGIGAALSGDEALREAYQSTDPYLSFAKQASLVPPHGTREDYESERDLCKACILGTQYGMGASSLGNRIGQPSAYAKELLRLHRQTYPRFWRWSDSAVALAMSRGHLSTVFGWTIRVGLDANPRSLRNYPCQGNGAEMMRLACSLATERGISVIAPVHDALLVEGPDDTIDEIVARTQEAMAEASEVILSGFRLRSDAKIVRWPDRYVDKRGREFWNRVMNLLPVEVDTRLAGG
jgi:hypothetical protein